MKITISKSILENILINAGPFLEKKDTSQITSHVFIKAYVIWKGMNSNCAPFIN